MKAQKEWSWKSSPVDPEKEHLELVYDRNRSLDQGDFITIARVGQPRNGVFPVQFLISEDDPVNGTVLAEVKKELDYYLVELEEPCPWEYACYHAETTANLYSNVHWIHVSQE